MKDTYSAKILEIRSAAGNPNTVCPTCNRRNADPYRRLVDGRIAEGCIDAAHTGQLVPTSESNRWQMRSAAVAMRLADLNHLRSL